MLAGTLSALGCATGVTVRYPLGKKVPLTIKEEMPEHLNKVAQQV